MSATLIVRDETTFGLRDNREFLLEVPEGRVTVRDLLRERVYGEVEDHNAHRTEHFRGLVQPTEAERTLNGFKIREGRRIDPDEQFERAVEAFYRNGFLVLVNDRQVEELDDEVKARPETTVTFLKLVPLVGG